MEGCLMSDCIVLFGSISSIVIAFLSLLFVFLTIRQNNKMIKNSTRPYVVAKGQVSNFQDPMFYIVFKNYGHSAAKIQNISFDINIKKYLLESLNSPFDYISDSTIAPNQTYIFWVDHEKLINDNIEKIGISINYTDNINTYNENFNIGFKMYAENAHPRMATSGDEVKIISYTLQDLVEKFF